MARIAMVAMLASTLWMGQGIAANPPWGGDDTGFLPPAKSPMEKCESSVASRAASLVTSLAACHDARVKGRLDVAGEESCEQTAIGKFKSRTKTIGCPTCTNLGTVSSALEAFVDSTAGALFCQPGGTPIGTDDQGRVPADAPNGAVTKCALKVNKLAMSLAKKMIKSCHTKRAGGKLTSESAEDACETALRTKFVQQVSGLTGCDPCVNGTSIAGLVESGVDGNNGTMYCSPSSAFLSRTRGWLSSLF